VNTVEMPIYWEQIERTQGHFDPSVLQVLIDQARQHHVRLVLLWFGLFKNGSGHYAPPWIKLNQAQVPHEVNSKGEQVDTLSPLSTFAMHAEAATFTKFMSYLKERDRQHTVIMVQVENETGSYGTERDHSPEAEKLFQADVPAALLAAMQKPKGTWSQVFGAQADEFFHAWYIGRYVEFVAAAGKRVNPLPMYTNAALRNPFDPAQCTPDGCGYDAGGPTSDAIPVWKVAAPSIDILSPDIYFGDYKTYTKELELYSRPDNALFVPETTRSSQYFFAALGHGALGWSPFGVDATNVDSTPVAPCASSPIPANVCGTPTSTPKSQSTSDVALIYETFGPMSGIIAQLNFEGKVQSIAENPDVHSETLHFGKWDAVVDFGASRRGPAMGNKVPGGAMVAQLGPDKFLVTGVRAKVQLKLADQNSNAVGQYIDVQEGHYVGNKWQFLRTWNGDQTDYGLNFSAAPQVLQVDMATYPLKTN
jgi:hypothetical protein